MTSQKIVSRHFFRRTARAAAKRWESRSLVDYTVVRAERGPFRWYVVRNGIRDD